MIFSRMKNKLIMNFALLAASISPSGMEKPLSAFAAENSGIATMAVNLVKNTSGTEATFYSSFPVRSMDENGYTSSPRHRLFRDVQIYGEEYLGDYAQYLSTSEANKFHFDKSTVNLYYPIGVKATFGINYPKGLIDGLMGLANLSQEAIKVDALHVNGRAMAYFTVTSSTLKFSYDTSFIETATQAYSIESGSFDYDFTFQFKEGAFAAQSIKEGSKAAYQKISNISMPSYGDFFLRNTDIPQEGSEYTFVEYDRHYDFKKGFIRCHDDGALKLFLNDSYVQGGKVDFVPYEITNFNYEEGLITLGNSVYGEYYGDAYCEAYLSSISYVVDGSAFTSNLVGMNGYNAYISDNKTENEKKTAIGHDFVFDSRAKLPNEVTKYGLVWSYKIPYVPIKLKKDAKISIIGIKLAYQQEKLGYYTPAIYSGYDFFEDNLQIDFYSGDYEYDYIHEECIGIAEQKIAYKDYGFDYVFIRLPEWWINMGIAFNPLGTILANSIAMWGGSELSKDKSVQRLFFNTVFNGEEITNITKIYFRYEEGHKEMKRGKDEQGNEKILPYDKDQIRVKSSDFEGGNYWLSEDPKVYNLDAIHIEVAQNGFFAYDDDNLWTDPIDNQTYKYFYQNVYNTKTYVDRINYFDVMTINFKIDSGTTKKVTTIKDGSYIKEDEEGNLMVVNRDGEVIEDTQQEVEDYVKGVDTTTKNGGTADDGDRNDNDKWRDEMSEIGDNIKDWFENLFKKSIDDGLKWLIISLSIIIGIVLVVIIVKVLFSGSGRRPPANRKRNYPRKRR